jgi:hypothetical protein
MRKLVMGLGVLFAVTAIAGFFLARGQDRDYNFTFTTVKGAVVVDKDNTSGLFVHTVKKQTHFNFSNETNPPVVITVKIFEPITCHVEFKPGNGCTSDDVPIDPKKKDKIQLKKDVYDGSCPAKKECDFNIQYKASDNVFHDIDPKLQIEDARLRDLLNKLRYLFGALALACLGGPAALGYMKRRQP